MSKMITRNRRRRKLSKLNSSPKVLKTRKPTCKGGFAFKSKKSYSRSNNKNVLKREMD